MTAAPDRVDAAPLRQGDTAVRRRAQVVGTGLIGGSLGLALRARGWRVTGLDRDPQRSRQALAVGALDAIGRDDGAEVTFICTPASAVVPAVTEALEAMAKIGNRGVVSDVAGVKGVLVDALDHPRFVGGHPMAGSEQEGVEGADGDLFNGAAWVLTPGPATDADAYSQVASVVTTLGASVVTLDARRHDELVAQVSHVPHLVAAALMNQVGGSLREQASPVLRLAAGGFRDMTRVAAGHPGIWPDICAQNAPAIASGLSRLAADLIDLQCLVAKGNRQALLSVLVDARLARGLLPGPQSRSQDLVEVRVPVADRPGVVAEVAALVVDEGVNIENLEIVHSPEGERGILVLVIDRQAARRVRTALAAGGYRSSTPTVSAPTVLPTDSSTVGEAAVATDIPDSLCVQGGRPLQATLRVPGDKSISHRALMIAALAEGESVVTGLSDGDDVARSASALQALGISISRHGPTGPTTVAGGEGRWREAAGVIDVGNSGTTLRLLAGIVAARAGDLTVLDGDDSIRRRPMDRVVTPLRAMGADIDGRRGATVAPLVVRGRHLQGIDYPMVLPSAQVKSAVLLAGLRSDGTTTVTEAVPTRAHTEEMLTMAGADLSVEATPAGTVVRLRPSRLGPFTLTIPGDPSAAAFWLVAACIVPGSEVTVENVYLGPARGGFITVLERMGADLARLRGGGLRSRYGPLRATEIAGREIPGLIDEIPVLAVAAALAEGTTVVSNAAELRSKESDRIATMTTGLQAMGADVEATPDGMIIHGRQWLKGADVDSCGDHRVAMALAVAALAAPGETRIAGWTAVATSYPGFAADLELCLR